MTFICEYKHGHRITIDDVNVFTPTQARDEAKKILADVARNIDPRESRRKKQTLTFWQFLNDEYGPWLKVRIKLRYLIEDEETRLRQALTRVSL